MSSEFEVWRSYAGIHDHVASFATAKEAFEYASQRNTSGEPFYYRVCAEGQIDQLSGEPKWMFN